MNLMYYNATPRHERTSCIEEMRNNRYDNSSISFNQLALTYFSEVCDGCVFYVRPEIMQQHYIQRE